MHDELDEIHGDPRIFENPIEASIDLSELSRQRLKGLGKRNRYLSFFGLLWTLAMLLMTFFAGLSLWLRLYSAEAISTWGLMVSLVPIFLFVPAAGLGVTLLILSFQERRFLSYLEGTTMAVSSLGDRVGVQRGDGKAGRGEEDDEGPASGGGSLAWILGSAMWVGDLVPTVQRMTTVARAILGIVILGLGMLVSWAMLALALDLAILVDILVEIAIFAIFVGPAILLFQGLTRDHDFYSYYSRRHRALAEVASMGIPPVPDGKSHLARFGKLLKGSPLVDDMLSSDDGGVEREVGRKGYRFQRYYHGTLFGRRTGILVKEFDAVPASDDLDILLEEAVAFGAREKARISRVVALVTAEVDDIGDDIYDHLISVGRRTRRGECALQLAMEVEGLYSLVPYVAM